MEKNKGSFKSVIKIVAKFISLHKLAVFFAVILVLLTEIGTVSMPLIMQNVIDTISNGIKTGLEINLIISDVTISIVILASCYIVSLVAAVSYTQIMAIIGQKFLAEIRETLFNHMQDLPIRYFDRNAKGDIMSIYINDVDTIRQLVIFSFPEILISIINAVSVAIIMLMSSIWLFFIVIFFAVLMVLVTKYIGGHSSKNFIFQQEIIGKEEGFVEEMMHGLKVIKSFNHEEASKRDFDAINKDLQKVSFKANAYANKLMPIIGNIGNLLYVVIALSGILLSLYNVTNYTIVGVKELTTGIIVSFLPMVRQFTFQIATISNNVNIIALAGAGAKRIFDLLNEEKEVDDGYVKLVRAKYNENNEIVECDDKDSTLWAWKHPHVETNSVTYTLLKGDIRMFDVDFGYVENKIVLHNVSLYAKPGQKLAFVGATGAGKTTITNLINRFYDIADGKVRYDGININKISKKDLRRSLGMVLQDTSLFSGTIMENIRYGRLDASDEECIAAAKLANADSFISRLPDGYQTVLENDGNNLSQGQRQLLSIARCAVGNAPVMILDEATSSIDTRTELLVNEGMDKLMEGRTVFVIAHRLSTIRNSNAIMVLDHGKVIERGTHEELIEKGGVYYQLYTGAFELE